MGRSPRYQPWLDVPATPFRWRLGLRPLDLADWIESDDHHRTELDRKAEIMADHPGTAFRVLDDIEDESQEILDALVAHLRDLDDDRIATVEPDPSLPPLDAAGRLVQEDLVLLVERDGALVCGGGSVCFPNRWDLSSKVGRTMAEIHAPVARLNDQLEIPVDKFLARLTPDKSFWRLGWGVLDTDELYQAVDGTAPPRPATATPSRHHLRVERETLRRFPRTRSILFTIRTHLCPLDAVATPDHARRLADALDALPGDVAQYKQLDISGPELACRLRELAATDTS